MKNSSRRNFISAVGTVMAGQFLLPPAFISSPHWADTKRYINGWLYDMFGYPVAGATAVLVKNYKMDTEYLHVQEPETIASAVTEANGHFFLKFDTAGSYKDVGVMFRINGVEQPINVFALSNANIPFPLLEIYSSNNNKWLKEMLPVYISEGAQFYIDTSRQLIQQYSVQKNPGLVNKLQGAEYKYHGQHTDPEHPNDCLGEHIDGYGDCDDHWGYPEVIDKSRKIILPWGKTDRRVIPYVVCEGRMYFVDAQTGDDYDRTFRMIVNPAYKHITNPVNPLEYCTEQQVDGEMCIWFMGKKQGSDFTPSNTSIRCDQSTAILAEKFKIPTNEICRAYVHDKKKVVFGIDTCSRAPVRSESDCKTRRVWMMGTWCADESHGHNGNHFNEIHPVYWVVPHFGAWERFHHSQYYVLLDLVARPEYFEAYKPEQLLPNWQDAINAYINGNAGNYGRYVAHLHQYGLCQRIEGEPGDIASSIDAARISNWSAQQSPALLKQIITSKTFQLYQALTMIGSGYMMLPCMFSCYETIELKKIRNKFSLDVLQPTHGIEVKQVVKDIVAKTKNYTNFVSLADSIKNSYHFCLDKMYAKAVAKSKTGPTFKDIADFYAAAAMRYISQALFPYEDGFQRPEYSVHYNIALEACSTGRMQALKVLMDTRIDEFWKDAIPFTRPL